jgi:uncharacterized protein YcbK (DUF882 family)
MHRQYIDCFPEGGRLMDRRNFLQSASAAAVCAPPILTLTEIPQTRAIHIIFAHTGEKYENFYYQNGSYIKSEIDRFSWVCRDFRANQWKVLNPLLMDLLFVLHWKHHQDLITIVSGYRTPETNAQLEGAALNSQHIQGNALDIVIPGLDMDAVAESFKPYFGCGPEGGVGIYPGRGFTHMDFGPRRSWVG